jgi:hypothetical protein
MARIDLEASSNGSKDTCITPAAVKALRLSSVDRCFIGREAVVQQRDLIAERVSLGVSLSDARSKRG